LIPTGELRPVKARRLISARRRRSAHASTNTNDEQIKLGNGYDHNWVLNKKGERTFAGRARLRADERPHVLEVWTTEPATQFYTGNFLDGTITGKGGWTINSATASALSRSIIPIRRIIPRFRRPN
jgi:aldose 1-epimerase